MEPEDAFVRNDCRRTASWQAGAFPAVSASKITGRGDVIYPFQKAPPLQRNGNDSAARTAGDIVGAAAAGKPRGRGKIIAVPENRRTVQVSVAIDLCAAHHADIYKAVLLIGKQPPQRHDGHGILAACAVTNPQDQPLRPGPQRTALCGNHGTGGMGLLRQQSAQEWVAHAGKDHLAVLYLTGRCNNHQLT